MSRIRGIPYYAEVADEIGHLYPSGRLKLIDHLAKSNQIAYEKIIQKRADKIFVFTSYLEHKYKKIFRMYKNISEQSRLRLIIETFDLLSKNDITVIKQEKIEQLESRKIKIVFAGACNRTNGLFFSGCPAQLKQERNLIFYILLFVYGDVNLVREYCSDHNLTDMFFFKPVFLEQHPAIYSKQIYCSCQTRRYHC